MEEENYSWTLGKPDITMTKTESLGASTTMYMNIWQIIVGNQILQNKLLTYL